MRRLATIVFMIALLYQSAFPQSEYLRRGKTGFGGGIGFSLNRVETGMYAFGGFSYKGIWNLDVAYAKYDGGKISDGVITPTITYYPVKQEDSKKAPTLGISIGYSQYNSTTISTASVPGQGTQGKDTTLTTTLKIQGIKLGVAAHHRIGSWKMFSFQPLLGGGVMIHRHGWEFNFRAGVSVISRIKGGPLFIFTPAFERQSGLSTLSVLLSAVM
jgi:hypothetical protein